MKRYWTLSIALFGLTPATLAPQGNLDGPGLAPSTKGSSCDRKAQEM